MKAIIFFCLLGAVACQNGNGRYVWDLLKAPLNVAEVQAILPTSRADGSSYPTYSAIPSTSFTCGSKRGMPGFYADPDAGCQVFHRCDINGNHTAYLCVNTTVFNQITLVCDYFFNVDCAGNQQYETYANSRLYQDPSVPLFDSPRPEENHFPAYLQAQAQTGVTAEQVAGFIAQPVSASKSKARSRQKTFFNAIESTLNQLAGY